MQLNYRRLGSIALIALIYVLSGESQAQQQDTTGSIPIVKKALAAMIDSGQQLRDITLQGDVEYIAGSTDETGAITLKAITDGSIYTEVALPSQTLKESVIHSGSRMSGQKNNGTSTVHSIALHNLMTDSAWFCPAMLVQHFTSFAQAGEVAYSTKTDTSGISVGQLASYRHVGNGNTITSKAFQRLTATSLFLDPSSSQPSSFTYNSHPDSNSLVDIPVRVQYEDYKSVDGVMVPMHIKKYVNGVLTLDIHVRSAVVNSGLVASQFSLQ